MRDHAALVTYCANSASGQRQCDNYSTHPNLSRQSDLQPNPCTDILCVPDYPSDPAHMYMSMIAFISRNGTEYTHVRTHMQQPLHALHRVYGTRRAGEICRDHQNRAVKQVHNYQR